jgi:hypothetical protein
MATLHPLRATLTVLALAVGMAAASAAIPDNPYQRWQLLRGTIYDNVRWIYERCRYDPTPIDIAVVGSSRAKQGVNAPRLQAALAARGLDLHVVNFSILSPGRGADYAVIREMLAHKHPRLLILGVQEEPDRNEHDTYRYLSSASDVATPQIWRRLSYVSDLGFVPFRQLRLLYARLFPAENLMPARFAPAGYAGASVDTTGGKIDEGAAEIDAEAAAPEPALDAGSARFTAKMDRKRARTARFRAALNRDDRAYLQAIVDMAGRNGAKVAFLFIPYFDGPEQPDTPGLYEGLGPLWSAESVSSDPALWADFNHLDRSGGEHVTDWLAGRIAAALKPAPATGRPS